MKLQQLRIFEAITRHLNVTAAARELHLSQPAASLQLKLLEKHYAITLFSRKSTGMELTDEGRGLLEAVRPILTQMRELDARYNSRQRSQPVAISPNRGANRVAIGSNHQLLETFIADAVIRFRTLWGSRANIVLQAAPSDCIERQVEAFELDVALVSDPRRLPSCEYESFEETVYDVVAVAGSSTPFCDVSHLSLRDLLRRPLVVRSGSICVQELRRRRCQFSSLVECPDAQTMKMAIRKGLGIGVVLRSWVRAEIDRQELISISVPDLSSFTYRSFITWNKRRALSELAMHLIQTLRQMRTPL